MATKSDSGFGLLSEHGLDLGTAEDVRSALRQKRILEATKLINGPTSGPIYQNYDPVGVNQSFAKLGATLAEAVGKRMGAEPAIPPEIQSRLDTVQATKQAYSEWEKANPKSTANERMEKYQELVAEKAFENGLPEVGISALRELQDRRAAQRKKEAELEKLGYENQFDRETIKGQIYKAKIDNSKAGVIEFFPTGSDNPNSAVVGEYNPEDGSVATLGPDGQPKIYRMGEWSLTRPMWKPGEGGVGGGRGGSGAGRVTPTEAGKVRELYHSGLTLHRDYLDVFKLLDEASAAGVGPIMGNYGNLLSFTNKWLSFADSLATAASPVGKKPDVFVTSIKEDWKGNKTPVTYNMGTAEGQAKWISDNSKWIRDTFPGLGTKAEFADQYASMMTQLAYSKAMISEGGSTRSLSDMDFKNNAIAVGAGLSDPKTLRRFLLKDADKVYARVSDRLALYDPATAAEMIGDQAVLNLMQVRGELDSYRARPEDAPVPPSTKTGKIPGSSNPDEDGWMTLNGVRVRVKQGQ